MQISIFVTLATAMTFSTTENAAEMATESVKPVHKVITTATWQTVLTADFKKPGFKDLFLNLSMECGLFTDSSVTPFSDASVVVRVLVNGRLARPGIVSFCGKSNGLDGLYAALVTCAPASSPSSCGYSMADVSLIRRSLRSHAFNFLVVDLSNDHQTIVVQARVVTGTDVGTAVGVIGKGSLEANVVNLKEEEE